MLKRILFVLLLALTFAAQAAVNALPWGPKPQFIDANGAPMSGGTLQTLAAGSSTPQVTYTDSTGGTGNPTTITLNTRGESPNEVWLTAGLSYKLILKDSAGATVWTVDNIVGVNDVTASFDEWKGGPSAELRLGTSFTLVGDQTTTFHIGRRLKTTNSGGTVYSTITNSVFAVSTTITVENDSSNLDSGLSAVSYSLISQANGSDPAFTDQRPVVVNITDRTKRVRMSASGLTASKTRVLTVPDQDFTLGPLPRSYLAGLTMSTAGSSATMTVAAGQAADTTNAIVMTLASSTGKTTGAWTVGAGNGCLDTGAIANTTWYHFYLIERTDTQVVDLLCSTSASAPTMPASYSFKRRIGAGKTDGAAQWVAFTQDGDLFQWSTITLNDVAQNNPGATAVSRTLTVPTGVNVLAIFQAIIQNVGAANGVYTLCTDLATVDSAPASTLTDLPGAQNAAGGVTISASRLTVRTNTSAQVRTRHSFSDVNVTFTVNTIGWIDRRGRDG
jgi:hypothetical protein